jgi:hypothetical protein
LGAGLQQRDKIVEEGGDLQGIEQDRLDEHGRRRGGHQGRIGFDLALHVIRDRRGGGLIVQVRRGLVGVEKERQLHRRPS